LLKPYTRPRFDLLFDRWILGDKRSSGPMKHFNTAQWLQFLRKELKAEAQEGMQQHLNSPCRKCATTLEALRQIEITARRDSAMGPPEAAVRRAHSIFALEKTAQIRLGSRLVARLIFDSFREPAMAGIRSSQQLARQTLYEAGDYTIDLRLEPDAASSQVVMVGQIANRLDPTRTASEWVVVLCAGHHELGKTATNQFGEFQIAYASASRLRLVIHVDDGSQELEVLLPGKQDQQRAPKKRASTTPKGESSE
jgi:hypothetical protein